MKWLLPVSAQEPDEQQQRTNKTEDERSTELSGERLLGPRAGAARLSLSTRCLVALLLVPIRKCPHTAKNEQEERLPPGNKNREKRATTKSTRTQSK
jgi:hypothetical protein